MPQARPPQFRSSTFPGHPGMLLGLQEAIVSWPRLSERIFRIDGSRSEHLPGLGRQAEGQREGKLTQK